MILSEIKEILNVTVLTNYIFLGRGIKCTVASDLMSDVLNSHSTTKGTSIDFIYKHCKNNKCFVINNREIKKLLICISINDPAVLSYLRYRINKGLKEIGAGR